MEFILKYILEFVVGGGALLIALFATNFMGERKGRKKARQEALEEDERQVERGRSSSHKASKEMASGQKTPEEIRRENDGEW